MRKGVRMPDVMSVIIKRGCFKNEDLLFSGVSNHCVIPDTFHTFIDCDDVLLRNVIGELEKDEYKRMGDWLIIQTSPWHFSLANFAMLGWNEYAVLLQDFPLVDEGYVHYTFQKGYAALRLGAKYGIVPTIMYKISNIPIGFKYCSHCYKQVFQFREYLKRIKKVVKKP